MSGKKAKAIRRSVRREIKRADVNSTRPRWMPRVLWDKFIKRVSLVFKPQPAVKTKNSLKITKRRNEMSNHNNRQRVPMPIPMVGGGMQQQPFDLSEAIPKHCEKCGGVTFDQAVKLGLISKMAGKNRTGQDVLVKFEVYLCRSCGHEYGQPVKEKDPYYPTAASPRSDRFDE